MQLIETIINELTDVNLSLTSPLLKTKVLASRIGNKELTAWVNLELNGYQNKEDLPDYRKATGNLIGDYLNGTMRVSNHVLPIPTFETSFDDELRSFELFDGIDPLEKMSATATESLVKQYNQGQVNIIQNLLMTYANVAGNFQLFSVGIAVPAGILKTTLNAVRNKLLDFMIALETEFGLEVKIETLQSNHNKITTIMNTTINTNGDGNLINTGAQANVTNTVTISKGNQEVLKKTLTDNQVSETDANELLQIIDAEQPISDTDFGAKVNKWIYTMMGKAMDGSWKIGIGAAGGLLAKAISHYYGLGG
ncbi:AbiTii domain-containing protein [Mucilaginibacter polytrichastri]|uniref:AbiTii domain-containing protein n=1 Tax=Mucilaginibacter polytrichastri TaxID=1302689 RepID=A0A1Q5ZWH7_9SPHI|nr:hypothetical protein [Mucilaginibacter polytrichastri]OKS86122.1 hypothetical protein RG47T_1572 [Mucilaginibacter polytrichastri]SFS58486.1 hypothetical protein SAMN04487890_10219 [Mucilaginibacter polytrichastri]